MVWTSAADGDVTTTTAVLLCVPGAVAVAILLLSCPRPSWFVCCSLPFPQVLRESRRVALEAERYHATLGRLQVCCGVVRCGLEKRVG